MKKRSLNFRSPLLLVFCTAAGMAIRSDAASGTWNQTAAGTNYSWTDSVNWLPNTGFPNGVDDEANVNINIAGAQTISLNAPITLGTLRLGDGGTAGFFTQTLSAGNGGTLTFNNTSGNAQLLRATSVNVPPVNPNLTDIINAPVTLASNLTITYPWVNGGNGFQLNGLVGGTGGITMVGVNYPETGAGMPQTLDLTNTANSFTGPLEVANGSLVFRGSVGLSTNSALGNSASAVLIGSPSSVTGSGTPSLQNSTTAELRMQALDDTSNYDFARDINFSGNTGTAAGNGRARFTLTSNGAGVANTNALTVSGTVTLASSSRGVEFLAARAGQTIRFTGDIVGVGGTGTIYWGPQAPGLSTTDGRNNGTYRFSDVPRPYTNGQSLTAGTVVIEGSVPASGSASPVGTAVFSLGDGNGGNFVSANTEGANRRLFLELAGTTYERILAPGGGSGFNLAGTAAVNGVTPAVYQGFYGNSGSVNLPNGYEFGGLNAADTIIYTAAITPGNVTVPATGTAGASGGTNPVTTVHNIALSAVAGGTVEFRGILSGSTAPALGTAAPGAAVTGNLTRVTINQFRNHPNLDTNLDGLPDANANKTTGTPTGGTVVLTGNNTFAGSTEVLGGILRLDYSINDTSKLSDTAPLILSGGKIEMSGGLHSEIVGSTLLSANTATTVASSNFAAPLNLNAITAQPGGAVNFAAASIATTDTLNTNGILGPWATINATDFATNSTNAADGLITAYSGYTDVTRKASGTKVIPNNPAANIRIVEGTGGAGDLTLSAAATTTIQTLNQSSNGGATAAVISTPGQTLGLQAILAGAGTGGLTIAAGTLQPAVSGGSLIIQNASANPITISSVIANNVSAGALSLVNSGTFILTAANTFTGGTSLFGGTLQLGDGITDGSLLSPAITNNGSLIYRLAGNQTYAGIISGTGSLTKEGAGRLTVTGANAGTGSVIITAGTLQLGDGGATGSLAGGSLLTNNGILGINRTTAVTQGTDFPRIIAGTGTLVKEGAGTMTLNGANTYAGVTTLTAGAVSISAPGALGSPAGETIINSNGTLTTGGRVSLSNNITVVENFTISGLGDGSPPVPSYNGAITATSGNNTITGTITLTGTTGYRLTSNNTGTVMNYGLIQRSTPSAGNLTLDPSFGATLTVNQALDLNGGALTCHGGGLVILNAEANDIGNTALQNGTSLRITANEALATNRNLQIGQQLTNTAAGLNNDVGTFDMAGKNQTVNALLGAPNAGTVPNNATASNRRLITSSQPGICRLTIGNGGTAGSFDGLIQNGSGTLAVIKTGPGSQTLSGPNTYSGDTSINGGTLVLGASTNLADTSNIRIDNPGSILRLADGIMDNVAGLFIDGVAKTGTWGSSLSAATNKDDNYFAGTGILSVSSGADPYTAWAASFGLQNPWLGVDPRLNGTPTADPDGDGKTNQQEYLFGLLPTSGASAIAVATALDKTTGLFTYTRRQPALTGAAFRYQWSTTLSGPWSNFTPDATPTNGASPVELLTVDVPNALLLNPRLFVRVITP